MPVRPLITLARPAAPTRHTTGTLYTMLPEQLRTGDHLIRGMCVREVDTILGTHVERDEHGAPTTFVDLLVSDNDKVYRWQLDTSAIVMVLR